MLLTMEEIKAQLRLDEDFLTSSGLPAPSFFYTREK